MSMFDEVNKDALNVQPTQVASARRLGFLGGFEAAYDQQVRASSQFGIEQTIRQKEAENRQRIRDLGGEAPPALSDTFDDYDGETSVMLPAYTDYMRAVTSGDTARTSKIIGDRNDKLRKLKEQYPDAGIVDYDEIFKTTRDEARAAEQKLNASPTTVAGAVGEFAGQVVGALDPRYNPLNFATLPIGGAGKTAINRIALQGLGQGAIETVNQFTGVREQRRALDLETNTLSEVAMAGLGGAAVQGLGEAVAAGARRWFRSTPTDPAPEPPPAVRRAPDETEAASVVGMQRIRQAVADQLPGGKTRLGMSRARIDYEHVASELERWDGPEPVHVAPPTDTRINMPDNLRDPTVIPDSFPRGGETVDEIARRLDPQTFDIWDRLTARAAELRATLADAERVTADARKAAAANEVNAQADVLRGRIARARGKNREKLQQELRDLVDNEGISGADEVAGIPERANTIRQQLAKVDEKMRDIAPAVTRAKARAQAKWNVYEGQRNQLELSLRDVPDTTPKLALGDPPPDLASRLASYARRTDVPGGSANESPADTVLRVQDADAKTHAETVDAFRAGLARAIKAEGDDATVTVGGTDYTVNMNDKITVPNVDGKGEREISIRKLLEETEEDNQILQAVTSCSIAKASQTA